MPPYWSGCSAEPTPNRHGAHERGRLTFWNPHADNYNVTSGSLMNERDSTNNPDPADREGERYHVLSILGRGATSTVYLARDRLLNRMVALKDFNIALSSTADERIRFEAHLGQELRHPNIVQVLGFERLDASDGYAIVLEHVDGASCRDRLESGWYKDPTRAIETVTAVARALAYAHGCGIIHRDVKPSNVLVSNDGTAKLADFGIAKCLDLELGLTGSAPVGTTNYLAPEILAGAPATAKSDIYSLGVLAKELWAAADRAQTMPRVAPHFEAFIEHCLAEQPTERPSAAEAVRILEGERTVSPAPRSNRRRRASRGLIVSVLLALTLGVACELSSHCLVKAAEVMFRIEVATGLKAYPIAYRLGLSIGSPHKLLVALTETGSERVLDALHARALLPTVGSIDARGAMCNAIRNHQARIVERLLDYGYPLSTECKDDQRVSGLAQVAIIRGDRATRELLIKRGAFNFSSDVETLHASKYAIMHLKGADAFRVLDVAGARKLSPEHQIVLITDAARWHNGRNLSAVLQAGVDLNVPDPFGNTALMALSVDCDELAVARLTELSEVRVDAVNTAGHTAADIACTRKAGKPDSKQKILSTLAGASDRDGASLKTGAPQ